MSNLYKNKVINTNFFYLTILGLFSFFINFYYSKFGTFPIDTFLHYDSAQRILKNELPIRDYWVVSGLVVDFIQSIFFKFFGINWLAYSLHASLFNSLMAYIVYFFFLEIKISNFKAFVFTISFATLSYTISGTPFVDLHATFFLLIATLLIMNNLNTQKNYLWSIITFLIFLSFLSKQVPATYAIFGYILILLYYFCFLQKKEYKKIVIIFFTALLLIISLIILLKFNKIDLKSFYIQYLDYPRSIGSSRLDNFEFSINIFFNKYKFIVLPLLILMFIKFQKIEIQSEETARYTIFFVFTIIIIFHQLMTKNQTYIYFLIPILFGLLEKEINFSNQKFKKYISIFMIIILTFITTKYHFRFNENRKFHELSKQQLENSTKAGNIHKSLSGLHWINPHFDGAASKEISILKNVQTKISEMKDNEIMLISHYKFLDSITNKNLNYPNKTFTIDGASVPLSNNKHFETYQLFLTNMIKEKKIDKILFLKHENISQTIITDYIDIKCFQITEDDIFYIYKLLCFK